MTRTSGAPEFAAHRPGTRSSGRVRRCALAFVLCGCASGTAGVAGAPATLPPPDDANAVCLTRGRIPDGNVVGRQTIVRQVREFSILLNSGELSSEPAEFLDRLLAAGWYARYADTAAIRLVQRPLSPDGRETMRYVCAFTDDTVATALALGVARFGDEALTPYALRNHIARSRQTVRGDIAVISDSALNESTAAALRDSLELLEHVMGVPAYRPVFIFAFSSQATLALSYPERWNGGQPGDISLVFPEHPGAVFIATRGKGLVTHELVHLISVGIRPVAVALGTHVPYYADEALARAIGGARGLSFAELMNRSSKRDFAGMLLALRATPQVLDSIELAPGSDPPEFMNALSALYRVAIVHCSTFPSTLLFQSRTRTVDDAYMNFSLSSGIPSDSVMSLAVAEMANDSTVLLRAPRQPRRPCKPV